MTKVSDLAAQYLDLRRLGLRIVGSKGISEARGSRRVAFEFTLHESLSKRTGGVLLMMMMLLLMLPTNILVHILTSRARGATKGYIAYIMRNGIRIELG